MLIRTFDGKDLINMDKVNSIRAYPNELSGKWFLDAHFDDEIVVRLGTYPTLDEALKVIDMICAAYSSDGVKVYTLPM